MMKNIVKCKTTILVAISIAFFTGCEGTTTSVSVGYGVYGGYSYGYYPPYYRPPKPPRPELPIERPRPSTKPTRSSMGRPSGMSMRRR